MGKTVRDLHPEDTKGALDAIEGKFPTYQLIEYVHEYSCNMIQDTCSPLT
jgi:hypothetical protein